MAPLCFCFWVCFCRWGDWIRAAERRQSQRRNSGKPGRCGKEGKVNAGTAENRGGKAMGSDSREAGREAGKRKRVNSASGWTADKSGKNDKRSGRGTFGWRLHGGKGAAKCRRSGSVRDHKRYGKKIENQSAAHGNRAARKAEIERGREVTKGGNDLREGICFGKRQWRKIPSSLWYFL